MPATATITQRRNVPSPAASGDYLETPVRDFMTPGVLVIADATARDALTALSQAGTSHLLVAGRSDAMPEGVVSELDIAALDGA